MQQPHNVGVLLYAAALPEVGQARDADKIADDTVAALRTAAEQRARDASRLDASVKAAQATLTQATDFIATRRGAVGTEARTRLAWTGAGFLIEFPCAGGEARSADRPAPPLPCEIVRSAGSWGYHSTACPSSQA